MKLVFWLLLVLAICGVVVLYFLRITQLGSSVTNNDDELTRERLSVDLPDRTLMLPSTILTASTGLGINGVALTLPWAAPIKVERGVSLSTATFKNNIICLITSEADTVDDVLRKLTTDDTERTVIAKQLVLNDKPTMFVLYQLLVRNREKLVLDTASQSAGQKVATYLVENGKIAAGSINKSSRFATGSIHGIQYGDPKYVNLVLVEFFTPGDKQISLWFSGLVSQTDIDYVLATLKLG